jgi:magnesium transporter
MLINCAAYAQGDKLGDIPVEAIPDYLARPGCFVWVALRDATEAELETMQRLFGLHDLAVEDARHGHQRPKVEEYAGRDGDMLFTVVHTLEGEARDPQVGEVHVFTGANFVLSVRNRSHRPLLGVRERCEREPHLLRLGPAFVLYALLDNVVDRYFPLIEELEAELEDIEEQIFVKGAARSNIERLYDLKHRLAIVKRAVAPLLDALGKLYHGRVPALVGPTEDYFRDVADHLARINGTLDGLRDTIGTAIQVNLSMVTIEEGEVTKRLAAWAGIFAVATAFVGVWGMNFEHMPELRWRWGYPAALGLVATVCGALYWRFRRAGWL